MADSKARDATSSTSRSSMQSPGSGAFSSAPVAPVVTRDGHARSSREWSKELPKRRAKHKTNEDVEDEEEDAVDDRKGKRQGKGGAKDSKEKAETEEGEDTEDEEAQDVEKDEEMEDADETGSDSDREQRKKSTSSAKSSTKKTKAAKEMPAKRDPKEKKTSSAPLSTRRKAVESTYPSDDGSETSSQVDTDDEMNGRRGSASGREPVEVANKPQGASTNSASPVAPRERNSSMTLPSLSRAAMIHMSRSGREGAPDTDRHHGSGTAMDKRSDDVAMADVGASHRAGSGSANGSGNGGGNGGSWRRDRSRSRSRERPVPTGGSSGNQWHDNQIKDNDDNGSNFSGEGNGHRDDEPPSPGHDGGQDVRIMFHGREIYADDLIGLRVAKTFVGHGRFLGQVVKFDEPTSLYTIVYADGDAEELSIENTIQILIQDEIERADPSVPPIASNFRNDRIPDSPEMGSVTPASSSSTRSGGAMPVAPLNGAMAPLPSATSAPAPSSSGSGPVAPPAYHPPRRSSVAISEREAQFVIGLFENHALPVLMRQGWRAQTATSGEQRFYAPPGNFRGAGHVFASALDVVELIACDNELLSVCFPQNVHSAILSLFPDPVGGGGGSSGGASASGTTAAATAVTRKRGTPTAPADVVMDGYDSKRVRGRDGYTSGGSAGSGAPLPRTGGPLAGRGGSLADDRLVPPVAYDHRESRDSRGSDRGGSSSERERERDPYGPPHGHGHQRMPAPLAAGERFPSNGPGRGEPSDSYHRSSSTGGGDYRSMPLRPLSAEIGNGAPPPSLASSSSSRWGGPPPSGAPDGGDYHHRRGYGDAPEWHERDQGYMGGGRSSAGGYRGEDVRGGGGGAYYQSERGLPRGGNGGGGGGGGPGIRSSGGPQGDAPPGYGRYRDARGPPSSGQYSPGPDSFSNRYPPSRGEPPNAGEYRGLAGGGSGGAPPADRFARPLSRGSNGGPGGGGGGAMLPPGPGGPGGGGGGGRGFSMMDVTNSSASGGGGGSYEHHGGRGDRGRSPRQSDPSANPPSGSSGSYGGPPPSHLQHYSHHQRSGSNGSLPNPAD